MAEKKTILTDLDLSGNKILNAFELDIYDKYKLYLDSNPTEVKSFDEFCNTLSYYIQNLSRSGEGNNFLSDDGTYKSIEIPIKVSELENDSGYLTDNDSDPFIKKSELFDVMYPVGSIYITVNNINPSILFGVGEWEQIKDTFLLASGDTYTAGETGGEAKHKLTYKELPETTGDIVMHGATTGTQVAGVGGCFTAAVKVDNRYLGRQDLTNSGASSIYKIRYSNGGNDEAHNNMPPYLVVYIWKRIN